MHYEDLSPYRYIEDSIVGVNVGWLGPTFETGMVPPELLDRLLLLASNPKNVTRGFHDCEFCDLESPIRIRTLLVESEFISLGNAEVHVRGQGGTAYIAPTLICHYIADHRYLPPQEFIEAVLDEP